MIETFIVCFTSCNFLFAIFEIWLHHFKNGLSFLKGTFLFLNDRIFVFSHISKNIFPINILCFDNTLLFLLCFSHLFSDILYKIIISFFICSDFILFSIDYLFYFNFIKKFPKLFIWSFHIFRIWIFGGFICAIKCLLQ